MLMVTKVVAAGVTALLIGGTPSPNGGALDVSPLASSPVVAVQTLGDSPCAGGCNVWRLIYDGR